MCTFVKEGFGLTALFRVRYISILAVLAALFGLVLLYIAYGIYFIFADPERAREAANRVGLAEWLKVKDLGQMKKTVLKVIVVLLAVLFLKLGLETQTEPSWSILIVPAGIVAIAVALKLIRFEH